jgi:hypothetical protein
VGPVSSLSALDDQENLPSRLKNLSTFTTLVLVVAFTNPHAAPGLAADTFVIASYVSSLFATYFRHYCRSRNLFCRRVRPSARWSPLVIADRLRRAWDVNAHRLLRTAAQARHDDFASPSRGTPTATDYTVPHALQYSHDSRMRAHWEAQASLLLS